MVIVRFCNVSITTLTNLPEEKIAKVVIETLQKRHNSFDANSVFTQLLSSGGESVGQFQTFRGGGSDGTV